MASPLRSVGIRELKQDSSRIVRHVAEAGEEISVTVRGEVVALLVPVRRPRAKRSSKTWTDLGQLNVCPREQAPPST